MPATDFNAAFFAKSNPTVDAEALAVFLPAFYDQQAPVYFAPTDDETSAQLNAFRASPEFKLLKTQYIQLVSALDAWCKSHQIQNIDPQTNKSALKVHLELLFGSNDAYDIRSVLFYNEGKRSLEILYFYLQNPHLSLEKKKDTLRNLQASIIACGDGTLTNILTAKDELVSSQDAQSILNQAKKQVIQQLALAFHGLYYEDYAPPRDYEIHRISAYCDLVYQHYGLALRGDLTSPHMPERVLKAFPSYLDTHIRPALIIEQLLTTFAPLIQQLHAQLQALFSIEDQPLTSLDYSVYNQTYREKIERRLAKWNDNYAFLCPLQVNDFLVVDGLTVSMQLFNHINLKARLATTFRTNYLTNTSPVRINIPNTYDHLEFHHDLFWMTLDGEICDLTPELFLKLSIPSAGTVESDAYWNVLNTLLQQFTQLLPAFTASKVHQDALAALLHQPQGIWKLAHQGYFSLLQLPIQERLITPLHLAQEGEIEAKARVNVAWLLTYHKQVQLLSELLKQNVLMASHLESCPEGGFWGGATPLWFLVATQQHAFIKALLDTHRVTLPQLELSEAVEQTTRPSLIWMLSRQQQVELIYNFHVLKLIPISQLQRQAQIGPLAGMSAIFVLLGIASVQAPPTQLMICNLITDLIKDKLIDRIQLSATSQGVSLLHGFTSILPLNATIQLLHSDQLVPEDFIPHALQPDLNPIRALEARNATDVIKLIVEKNLIIEIGIARFTNTASPIPLNGPAVKLHELLVRYNLKDLSGATLGKALRMAANSNAIDDLNLLLNIDKSSINQQDCNPEKRQTPLHLATSKGHIASIEALIKAGAEVNIPNAAGQTALDLVKSLTPASLKLYKLFGIQPKDTQEAALWTLIENYKQDTLSSETFGLVFRRVAFEDETQHLQFLLTLFPDVLNKQGAQSGKTALHQAIENRNLASAEFLLRTGANIDISDRSGKTARKLIEEMTPVNTTLLRFIASPPGDDDVTTNFSKETLSPIALPKEALSPEPPSHLGSSASSLNTPSPKTQFWKKIGLGALGIAAAVFTLTFTLMFLSGAIASVGFLSTLAPVFGSFAFAAIITIAALALYVGGVGIVRLCSKQAYPDAEPPSVIHAYSFMQATSSSSFGDGLSAPLIAPTPFYRASSTAITEVLSPEPRA